MSLFLCLFISLWSVYFSLQIPCQIKAIIFAAVIWNPSSASGRQAIGGVQKRFLSYLYFRKFRQNPHYVHHPVDFGFMLREFYFDTLEKRLYLFDLHYGIYGFEQYGGLHKKNVDRFTFRVFTRITRNYILISKSHVHPGRSLQIVPYKNSVGSNSSNLDPLSPTKTDIAKSINN